MTRPENCLSVLQGEYTIVKDGRPHYLQTYGLGPCLGLALWDEANRAALMTHIDGSITKESLIAAAGELIKTGAQHRPLTAALTGGDANTSPKLLKFVRHMIRSSDLKGTKIILDDAVDRDTSKIKSIFDSESLVLDTDKWQIGRIRNGSRVLAQLPLLKNFLLLLISGGSMTSSFRNLSRHEPISDMALATKKGWPIIIETISRGASKRTSIPWNAVFEHIKAEAGDKKITLADAKKHRYPLF